MVLSQKLHEAFKGTVERITAPRTVSALKEKGVLSITEFIVAGDNLVSKCPTWSWSVPISIFNQIKSNQRQYSSFVFFLVGRESGEQSKMKSYLPPEKQFLITRNGKKRKEKKKHHPKIELQLSKVKAVNAVSSNS